VTDFIAMPRHSSISTCAAGRWCVSFARLRRILEPDFATRSTFAHATRARRRDVDAGAGRVMDAANRLAPAGTAASGMRAPRRGGRRDGRLDHRTRPRDPDLHAKGTVRGDLSVVSGRAREVVVASPYFVPARGMRRSVPTCARRELRLVTNSLAATTSFVHVGTRATRAMSSATSESVRLSRACPVRHFAARWDDCTQVAFNGASSSTRRELRPARAPQHGGRRAHGKFPSSQQGSSDGLDQTAYQVRLARR